MSEYIMKSTSNGWGAYVGELTRCKDCKNWEKNDWNPNGMCRAFDDGSVCVLTETDKDEYCARAERKE